jgi:hypothetical protein
MRRVRAADDFEAIRLRVKELRRQRAQRFGIEPAANAPAPEPGGIAHRPAPLDRLLTQARRRLAK